MPPAVAAWADEHADLLELVAAEFVASASWPEISALTKRLARAGKPLPLRTIFFGMPKPLGWIDHNPERIVLSLHGLRFAGAAWPLLEGYLAVLRLAVERFPNEGDEASIRSSDLEALVEPGLVEVLSMLLQAESPFLGGFQFGEGKQWMAPVDQNVVNYWEVQIVDDFLRIRAQELSSHPQLGWGFVDLDDYAPVDEVAVPEPEHPAPIRLVDQRAESEQLGVVVGEHEWRLGVPLDRGGMGQVFEAEASEPPAVIKLVEKDPGAERELLFANPTGVSNVVPIWDKGEWHGYWFLVMPRAQRSLAAHLQEHGRLSAEQTLEILADVADALVGLHGQLVHRDLKPGNILLLGEHWCLADFGIARYAEATTATETRKWAMTPAYAAPEQWRHEHATAATDIYAVGIIAYELLTGEVPFIGPGKEDFRAAHLYEQPPELTGVGPALASLVSDCINKSAGSRPSATEFRNRLQRVARPPASGGLASLQSVNSAEARRLGRVAAESSEHLSAEERRQELVADAARSYRAISDALFEAIVADASSARARRDPDVRNWQISLGRAQLQMTPASAPEEWPADRLFDLVLVGAVAVSFDGDPYGYRGRAHSLWFADAQEAGRYQWYETGFELMALTTTMSEYQPFPLDGGIDAAQALLPAMHTHQVAWPFTPLTLGDLDDFIGRWAGWLAEASAGQLQRATGGAANAQGSWRRG
jgi:serine/threonine-protein kinase